MLPKIRNSMNLDLSICTFFCADYRISEKNNKCAVSNKGMQDGKNPRN